MRESDFRAINKFKVPKKVWGSWTLVAKHVFNKLYESMLNDRDFYVHTDLVSEYYEIYQWKITAWNAAFMAASICSRGERHLLKDLTERVKS